MTLVGQKKKTQLVKIRDSFYIFYIAESKYDNQISL